MIEIVWEFVVKEEVRGKFELAYGPGGAWSDLFGHSPGFRGITLLRDTKNPRRYLTIDLWDTLDQREQMMAERMEEYSILQDTFADWSEYKVEVGIFRVQTEATVRPRTKAVRRKAGGARRERRSKNR
jgi:hypothetical protein